MHVMDLNNLHVVCVEWKSIGKINDSPRDVHGITIGWMVHIKDMKMRIAWKWDNMGKIDGFVTIPKNSIVKIDELYPPFKRIMLGTLELHQ